MGKASALLTIAIGRFERRTPPNKRLEPTWLCSAAHPQVVRPSLLQKALEDEIALYISIVSCIEGFYVSWQEQGKDVAIERLRLINDLPVIQEPVDGRLTTIIGEVKATKAMSFADCCIAGLAEFLQATLVHKDPEYEQMGE